MRVIRISDWRVAQIVGVLVLIQLLISVLGSTVTELRGDVVIIDAYRLSKNYPACFSTEAASTTLLIIEGVFVLFLLVVGGVLAFRVRRIPYDMYDESKVIFFTIYNVAFFAIVAIVLEFAIGSINDSNVRNIVFIIRSACTLLGTGISVLTFMISKMTMLKSTEKDSSNVTTALTRTTNNKSGGYASSVLKSTHSSSIGSADLTKVKYDAQRAKYKAKIELLHALLKEHNIAVPGEESSTSSSSDDDGTSTSSTDTSSTKKKKKDKKSDDVKIAVEADGANEVAEEDGDEEAEEADEEESSN
jgi:predicted small integral membrane protein